jgi:hypothetical protein
MDWRYGSISKAPALQTRSPEFKLQSHKKKRSYITKISNKVDISSKFKGQNKSDIRSSFLDPKKYM